MKKVLLREKIRNLMVLYLVLYVILEGILAYMLFGFENEENTAFALKLAMIFLSTGVLAAIFLMFYEFLIVSDRGVTRYRLFARKGQINWRDVTLLTVEDRAVKQGKTYATFKYTVIRDVNDNEIIFFYDNKSFGKFPIGQKNLKIEKIKIAFAYRRLGNFC